MVNVLTENDIEYRPIVTGNFLKNVEVLEHFDYEVSGTLENSEHKDANGIFVGNHHIDIRAQIDLLYKVLTTATAIRAELTRYLTFLGNQLNVLLALVI